MLKKIFGGLDITWKKLLIAAVAAGLYTGVMAGLPMAKDTSFADISITFEWWILFGILIIVNSKSPLDSALKCLVFFLISQPLVYLVQVPFNAYGWQIFRYYPTWFVWTVLTLPMGYIGYYMKKEKWWSLLILVPMLAFLGYHYQNFLSETRSFFPRHLLSTLFCGATMLIYPLGIFREQKIRRAGLTAGLVLLLAFTALSFAQGKHTYSTDVLLSGGSLEAEFDDSYTASLEDASFGKVSIEYESTIECYKVHADFEKLGETRLILESSQGEKQYFDLNVGRDTYSIDRSAGGETGE